VSKKGGKSEYLSGIPGSCDYIRKREKISGRERNRETGDLRRGSLRKDTHRRNIFEQKMRGRNIKVK